MAEGMNEARGMIEAAIAKIGLDPATLLTKDSAEQVAWTLKRGSAGILVMLLSRADGTALRVVSPTVIFDSAKKNELFARVLELNADGLMGCAFGVVGDKVIVVTERPIKGLSEVEVSQAIRTVAAVSDTYDDKLVAEYGGKRASDA